MKKFSKLIAIGLLAAIFLAKPIVAFAAVSLQPDININAPAGFTALSSLTVSSAVSGGIKLILILAALLFFFMLVIGGIQWIVSGGDKTGSENARKKITSALVGLAIVFSAWAIVSLIGTLFGVDIFTLKIPSLVPTGIPAQ